MSYVYYAAGNIQTVSKSGTVYDQYAYDELGQLIREDNKDANKSYTYTYDSRGNILEKKTYAFTLGTLGTVQSTHTYGYATDSWKDRLTSYNGSTITYDAIGNPLTYNNGSAYTFTWEGRQMQSATKGNTTWTYTYNADGLRTGKTNGTTTYTYTWNDGKLTSQTWGNSYMLFYYNAEGKPLYVEYHDANDECSGTYYYVLNLQGDTVALYDPARNITAVNYEYDAWGRELSWSTYDSGYAGLIFNNPLTYRGYIYDRETGFYYLQSRYYDPTIGRFLNADDTAFLGASGTLLSWNLFGYCENEPISNIDETGMFAISIGISWFTVQIISLLVAVVVTFALLSNPDVQRAITDLADAIGRGVKSVCTSFVDAIDVAFSKAKTKAYDSRRERHHIVAKGASNSYAVNSRRLLQKAGIGINSSENLVAIKYNLHRVLHTKAYYMAVDSLMQKANGKYSSTVAVLNFIKKVLLIASQNTP